MDRTVCTHEEVNLDSSVRNIAAGRSWRVQFYYCCAASPGGVNARWLQYQSCLVKVSAFLLMIDVRFVGADDDLIHVTTLPYPLPLRDNRCTTEALRGTAN